MELDSNQRRSRSHATQKASLHVVLPGLNAHPDVRYAPCGALRLYAARSRSNPASLSNSRTCKRSRAGGTAIEVEHLRSSGSYEFPVVGDESYAVHKLLGEPRTPFTLLVDREGKVLFAYLGIIEDIDAFYQKIQDMVK